MKFRRFVCGKPVVVINDGKIQQYEMKRLRMTTEDLSEQLRQMNVFNPSDVAFAIIETNGKMSVMKKPEKEPPTAKDLGVTVADEGLYTVVVSDGEISDYSLKLTGISRDWIKGVLKGRNINIEDVFIMTANKNKDFRIIEKE